MWLVLSMMLACNPTPGAPGASVPSGSTTDSHTSTTAGSTLTMADFAPAPAALHRLTERHYRAATEAVVGIRYEGELPVDYQLHGCAHVGAGELSIGPLDLELYEAAAWELAMLSLPDDDSVEALLGCPYDSACLELALGPFLRRAWRRPAPTPRSPSCSPSPTAWRRPSVSASPRRRWSLPCCSRPTSCSGSRSARRIRSTRRSAGSTTTSLRANWLSL